jgi:hypothetical protein
MPWSQTVAATTVNPLPGLSPTNESATSVGQAYLAYQPRISILTLTNYGSTAESAKTAVLGC